MLDQNAQVREIDIEKIEANRYQPRSHMDSEDLWELSSSIRALGVIQPPVVRPVPGKDRYELIAGERRLRAATLAGLKTIPVIVKTVDGQYSAEMALAENIQRVDLNPIDMALAMKRLMEEFSLTQEEVSQRVGKKRSTVANYLRLLTLPANIQEMVKKGTLSVGHAKIILSVPPEAQQKMYEKIVSGSLTVRQTEDAASESSTKPRHLPQPKRDIHAAFLAEKLQEALATKVAIYPAGQGGKVVIEYTSPDDLSRLLELLHIDV